MFLTTTQMNYDQCRTECQSYGADLYVPTTDEQFQALLAYHTQQGNGTFFLILQWPNAVEYTLHFNVPYF